MDYKYVMKLFTIIIMYHQTLGNLKDNGHPGGGGGSGVDEEGGIHNVYDTSHWKDPHDPIGDFNEEDLLKVLERQQQQQKGKVSLFGSPKRPMSFS